MHPRTDQSLNYNIPPLVQAGYAVVGRARRAVNNDVDTVHEEILLDLAAGVRMLRDSGCERVVLLGNSGGGALARLYQAQAQAAAAARLGPQPYGRQTGGTSSPDRVSEGTDEVVKWMTSHFPPD